MVTPWAANIDTKIVGSSHTLVAFFHEKFSNPPKPDWYCDQGWPMALAT